MFQSLVGFKINWNSFHIGYLAREIGFNPQQGLRLIGTNFPNLKNGKQTFQSLVGFKINWNSRDRNYSLQKSCFNPQQGLRLIGTFLQNSSFLVTGVSFQSLVGFKINWNKHFLLLTIQGIHGFNPQQGLRLIGTFIFLLACLMD